jgi:hypothetical protein
MLIYTAVSILRLVFALLTNSTAPCWPLSAWTFLLSDNQNNKTRCKYCQGLTFDKLVLKYEDLKPNAIVGYRHQPSFSELKVSAKTCNLCHLFARALETDYHQDPTATAYLESINDEFPIIVTGNTVSYGDEPLRLTQITVEWASHCSSKLSLFAEQGRKNFSTCNDTAQMLDRMVDIHSVIGSVEISLPTRQSFGNLVF